MHVKIAVLGAELDAMKATEPRPPVIHDHAEMTPIHERIPHVPYALRSLASPERDIRRNQFISLERFARCHAARFMPGGERPSM